VKISSPDVPTEDMRPNSSWTTSYSLTTTESPSREPVQLSQSGAVSAEIMKHVAETNAVNNIHESEDLPSVEAEIVERANGGKAAGLGTPADSVAAVGISFLTEDVTFSKAKEDGAIKEVCETVSFANTVYKLV
jgi:hypothetical protein